MKAGRQKFHKFWCLIPVIIGVIFLCFAIRAFWHWHVFEITAQKTTGTIVRFNETEQSDEGREYRAYTPVFSFVDINGKKHDLLATSSSEDPSDRLGDSVKVIYDPAHPDEGRLYRFPEIYGDAAALGVFALIFLLAGGIPLLFFSIRQKRVQWLKEHGEKVQAEIIEVKAVKHKHNFITMFTTYEIKAHWKNPYDNQVCIFSSAKYSSRIMKDPTLLLPKEVTILIDPNNPQNNYWMDLDFLKK